MPSIFLSPSLQEWNKYTGGGNEEYYMNLIADAMEPYLISSGITFTRNDPDDTLRQAINLSNAGNYDFHLALARVSKNETVTDFLQTVFCYLREGDFGPINNHLDTILRERSQRDHKIILQNIIEGDADAARDNMTRHLSARIALIKNIYHPDLEVSELTTSDVMEAIIESSV